MLRPFKTVLTSRNATLMLVASVTSTFGDWAYFIAISVFMAKNDAISLLATIATVRFACTVALTPLGGALVERWPKKLTMISADLVRVVLMLLIAIAMTYGMQAVWWVVVLSAFSSLAGIVFGPARRALLPQTVEESGRLALNALDGSIGTLSLTLAPALAGLGLMAMSPSNVVMLNALSFLGSAAALFFLRVPENKNTESSRRAESLWPGMKEGLSFILRTPEVSAVTGLAFVSHIAVGATWVFVPSIILKLGFADAGTGYLSSAIGVGSMLGMLVGGILAQGREMRTAFVSVMLFTAAMGLWAILQHSVLGAFSGAVLLGLTANVFEAPCWSILQSRTGTTLYARVFSAFDAIALLGMCLGTQASALALKQFYLGGAILCVTAIMATAYVATFSLYFIRMRR